MIFDFASINMAEKMIGLMFAVMQAVLIALITKNALDRALQKEKEIGKRLKDYGIESVKSGDGKMSSQHVNLAFGLRGHAIPKEISLCFITGRAFFRDFQEKSGYIGRAAANGCAVRVLLANPYCGAIYAKWKKPIDEERLEVLRTDEYISDVARYYYDLLTDRNSDKLRCASFIERSDAMLLHSKIKGLESDKETCLRILKENICKYGDHRYQVLNIKKMLREPAEYAEKLGGAIELRYYTDEYRLPITLIKKDSSSKVAAETLLWTNMNAATRETTESINIFCRVKENEVSAFVADVEDTFDFLWECYPNNRKNPEK